MRLEFDEKGSPAVFKSDRGEVRSVEVSQGKSRMDGKGMADLPCQFGRAKNATSD